MVGKDQIDKQLSFVKDEISHACRRVSRLPQEIRLVAISKMQASSAIQAAFECGQVEFGENYVQEAQKKMLDLSALAIQWHFVGHIQTNKVKQIVGKFTLIHSVDRIEVAREISKCAGKLGTSQDILIEVNLGGELSKSGVLPDQGEDLIREILQLSQIRICGLMALPPISERAEDSRLYFSRLRTLRETWGHSLGILEELSELSMGTSDDYVVAIEEGATIVRVGTKIFGSRR